MKMRKLCRDAFKYQGENDGIKKGGVHDGHRLFCFCIRLEIVLAADPPAIARITLG